MGLWKRSTPRDESVTASAGAITRSQVVAAATDGRHVRAGLDFWQSEIDMYDEWGPGFVGSYLDLVSDKVSKADAQLMCNDEVEHDSRLVAIFRGVWSTWRGEYNGRSELLTRHARLRAKHGECFILHLPSGAFAVAHKKELDWKPGYVVWIDPVTELKHRINIPEPGMEPSVWRSWTPLDQNPRNTNCELKRALPHIREYINVKLRQDIDTTSPLVRNRILMFGNDTEKYRDTNNANNPMNGMPEAFIDFLNLAKKRETLPYHTKRRPQDTVPFPMIGDKLEVIDLGRDSDPQSAALEESAIFAFARSVRVPAQYIHSGPGVAKFENEDFVLEALLSDAIAPMSTAILNDIWRVVMRKRFALAYSKICRVPIEQAWFLSGKYSLAPDLDRVRPKIDDKKDKVEGYKVGAVTRQAVADSLDTECPDLPEDVTEFDFWKLVTGTKDPAVAAPAVGTPPTPAVAAKPKPKPKPVALAAAADVPSATDELKRIMKEARRTDEVLFTSLSASAQAAYAALIDEAARNLSRVAPAGSDLKVRLSRANTSQEKLALLTPDLRERYGITDEVLVPDDSSALKRLQNQGDRDIAHALEGFALLASLSRLGTERIALANAAAAQLSAGVLNYVRYRVGTGAPDPSADIPARITRNSLAVAGGVDPSDIAIDPSAITAAGATVSPSIASQLAQRFFTGTGKQIEFQWVHGMYRTPRDSDPVHEALDGYLTASPQTPVGGRYPGDHHNCTCGWEYA